MSYTETTWDYVLVKDNEKCERGQRKDLGHTPWIEVSIKRCNWFTK